MKILKGKEKPSWVGKVLRCTNGKCLCRFKLELKDKKKIKHEPSEDCGGGYDYINCPKCGDDVVLT